MTNSIKTNMVGDARDVDGPFLVTPNSSPIKGKNKTPRNSPRVKQNDFHQEWEKNRVRFGQSSYMSPRGSPNGKSRGTPSKSPRQSPSHSDLYAGFSDSPAPAALPKPPSHWMTSVQTIHASRSCHREAVRFAPSIQVLLSAQA